MWTYAVFWLAVMATVLCGVALTGKCLAPLFARRAATDGKMVGLFKVSCFASQLISWSIFVVILEWIIAVVAHGDLLNDNVANFLASGILLAVPVAIAITQGQKFWDSYWESIAKELGNAIPETGSQRQTYNEQHNFLVEGSSSDRNLILKKILKPMGPGRVIMGGHHNGSQQTPVPTMSSPDAPTQASNSPTLPGSDQPKSL